MVTKSSEEKKISHQTTTTFSEEIKSLSPNIKKYIKMLTKSYFGH